MYDPKRISDYFNNFGEEEWNRLESSPKNLMSLAIHQHYLQKYLPSGSTVLELGAGAGRFSVFMAQLGLRIMVSDVSPVQLKLARNNIEKRGLSEQVIDYRNVDITDLTELYDNQFDHTVAIGGPLSYVFEQNDQAMKEMLRVTKPGGVIILGVMSRYGGLQRTVRRFVPHLIEGDETVTQVLDTGDNFGYLTSEGHDFHLYTYKELHEFLENYPAEITEATATSYLAHQRIDELYDIVDQEDAWKKLLEMELKICKEIPDGGSHILAVLRKQ